ncbi:INO80 complex subunit C-like [Oppia nitens]|uniref:INO80 complex subunit C-like n=1 Tax=Oppia nitens TaxID=1686743 RepID=UPI0023DA5C0B|nr:INO80 complex subunit C-like [Oppia nitens]
MVKKKKSVSPDKSNASQDTNNELTTDLHSETISSIKNNYSFKSQEWVSSRLINNAKKAKVWKNLKQILAIDKTSTINGNSYASLDCHPSQKVIKRYSDLSGLPAKYKDPTTQLLYHNLYEFAIIKTFSNDIINGYLELRKANS